MSADVLREAATLMRKRAEAATPGRWEPSDSALSHPGIGVDVYSDLEGPVVADCCGYQGGTGIEDGAHIASWHPAVALAVADWLDNQANLDEEARAVGGRGLTDIADSVIVARAYLGTDA